MKYCRWSKYPLNNLNASKKIYVNSNVIFPPIDCHVFLYNTNLKLLFSRLVALSNQLQVEQDKYMDIIRASLRHFRQHLDDTLQMLRESNARFIKSFK